jgi:hypothetical protein
MVFLSLKRRREPRVRLSDSRDDLGHPWNEAVSVGRSFHVRSVQARLVAGKGGYEVVHESPGLEVGVYVLVAPEPDRQQPHEDDELYVVLEGRGVLDVEEGDFGSAGLPGVT